MHMVSKKDLNSAELDTMRMSKKSDDGDDGQRRGDKRRSHGMLHFSILTPILAQGSFVRALTYTTQVRSGGSQVFVGNRNHRAEPLPVLRRAPHPHG